MRSYCQLLGLINLAAFSACVLWAIGGLGNSGAPIITGALTLNMAMAWLFLAGIRRSEDGTRIWSMRPAFDAIVLFVVLAIMALIAMVRGR